MYVFFGTCDCVQVLWHLWSESFEVRAFRENVHDATNRVETAFGRDSVTVAFVWSSFQCSMIMNESRGIASWSNRNLESEKEKECSIRFILPF